MLALVTVLVTCASLALAGAAAGASLFYIRGGGDGHGIGMSQYGAYGYAQHGKRYQWILAHYYRGTRLGHTDANRTVRVLLGTGSAAFAGAASAAGKTLDPSLTYTVRPLPDGTLGVFNAAGKRVARGTAPLTATGPAPLTVAALGAYRGSLEFRPDGSGGVETVEVVGLDDYVRGVISKEIPSSWAPEALETQAVAARTYAITTNVGGGSYDLYPDTRSQMYGGVAAETPSTDAAVAVTRGQIVTYNGAPAVTYFFNSSGGHTENIENVWPGATPEPWLRGVPDPYDSAGGDPYHRWGYTMTMEAATAKLGSLVRGSLLGIRVTQHGSSPRILKAQVVGTRGTVSVTGAQLQQTFGLLTTYAAFTTISSAVRLGAPAGTPGSAAGAPADARAMAALVPLVQALVSSSTPHLAGVVFPSAPGTAVQLEAHRGTQWTQVVSATTGAGGSYSVALPGPGVYRIVAGGLAGPAVPLG